MNRIKDYRSFENGQVISSVLEEYVREDIDRLIKTKSNRGERHSRGLKTRGQHTKTTGRKGKTMGLFRRKKKAAKKTKKKAKK